MSKKIAELLFPNSRYSIPELEEKYPARNLEKNQMVTRFAPSPTGEIHMGSLFAAFIGSTFAHQNKGIFYLRIEDTDQKREIENGIEKILRDLHNLQIKLDEGPQIGGDYGPYIQSERKEIYQAYVKQMVVEEKAYPCFLTKEELESIREEQALKKERTGIYQRYAKYRNLTEEEVIDKLNKKIPYVIRLKSQGSFENRLEFHDAIKGKVEFPENDMDIILLKEDGLPTYHLAHVIDDHLMHTTHVIRGDEWLSSVPVHLELTSALGWKVPRYAHISPLTKKDGDSIRKLSKRKDKEGTVHFYHEQGIPVAAIKLYLATIMNAGFEPFYLQNKDNKIEDFHFEFSKMSTGGSLFDLDKLMSISKIYFSRKTGKELLEELLLYTQEYDPDFYQVLSQDLHYAEQVLDIERNKKSPRKDITCYKDIQSLTWYMFDYYFYQTENPYQNVKFSTEQKKLLKEYFDQIYNEEETEEEWYQHLKDFGERNRYAPSVKLYKDSPEQWNGHIGHLCEIIRIMLTACKETPNIYEILHVLGKERIKKRQAILENDKK